MNMFKQRLGISLRITIIFIIMTAGLLAGAYFSLGKSFREQAYLNIQNSLQRELSLVRSFVESANQKDLDGLADLIGRDLGLRTTIISPQGKVVGDSEVSKEDLLTLENHLYRPEVQQAKTGLFGQSKRFSTTIKQNLLYMATRYGKEGQEGFIRLAIPLSEVDMVSQRVNHTIFGAFGFVFLFAVGISYIASRWVSRPVELVAQAAKRVKMGDYGGRILIRGKDELGDLAVAFNEMNEQIRERIREVSLGKSRLEAVFLSMLEGVLVVGGEGEILLINNALKTFLGVAQGAEGKRPLEAIGNTEIQELIVSAQKNPEHIHSREIRIFSPENRIFQVNASAVMRRESLEGVVLVFHDITEVRRLEQIRKDFVANVSHELRTPIASIKGYAETLLNGALKDEEHAEEFVGIIFSDADRLAKLIDDILALSAIESGKLIQEFRQCSLRKILERVLASVKVQAKMRHVNVVLKEGSEGALSGDEMSLFRLMLNLVENAVKYNREGGVVDILIEEHDSGVTVSVRDEGIGIPVEDQSRVFERFYRVDKAHSRELGGTGLGLAIVKHIAQAHGGMVALESVLGKGSVFTVSFPRA